MRIGRIAAVALALMTLMPAVALGAASINVGTDTKSADLVEQPKKFDGKTITFRGEVIGERMARGANAWLHINDDAYFERNIEEGQPLGGYNSGHAIWIPTELTDGIEFYGDYRHEGDIVRVRGEFRAACPEHGGDMDIHATSLEILRPGHRVVDPIHPRKTVAALLLGALSALLYWLDRKGIGPRIAPGRPQSDRRATAARAGDR